MGTTENKMDGHEEIYSEMALDDGIVRADTDKS